MSDGPTRDTRADDDERELVLEYDLDAAPDKVWRAVTIPALRERWLPGSELAEPEPVSSVTGEEVRYRIATPNRRFSKAAWCSPSRRTRPAAHASASFIASMMIWSNSACRARPTATDAA